MVPTHGNTNTNTMGVDREEQEAPIPSRPQTSTVTPMTRVDDEYEDDYVEPEVFLKIIVDFQVSKGKFETATTIIPIEDIMTHKATIRYDFMDEIESAISASSRKFPKCTSRDRSTIRDFVTDKDFTILCNETRRGKTMERELLTPKMIEKYILQENDNAAYCKPEHQDIELFVKFPADFILGCTSTARDDSSFNISLPNISPMPTGSTPMKGSVTMIPEPQNMHLRNTGNVSNTTDHTEIHANTMAETSNNPDGDHPTESQSLFCRGRAVTLNAHKGNQQVSNNTVENTPVQSPIPQQSMATQPNLPQGTPTFVPQGTPAMFSQSTSAFNNSTVSPNITTMQPTPVHVPQPTMHQQPVPLLYPPMMQSPPTTLEEFLNVHTYTSDQFIDILINGPHNEAKNFLKKEYIPTKGKLSWPIWYKRFSQYGLDHGIYIPPFESLEKHQPKGSWFSLLPPEIQTKTNFWSQQILRVLSNDTTIKESPELDNIRRSQCGYKALYSVMQSIPHTIISPNAIAQQYTDIIKHAERIDLVDHSGFAVFTTKSGVLFELPLRRHKNLSWTESAILPTYQQRRSPLPKNLSVLLPPSHSTNTIVYEDVLDDDIIHTIEQVHIEVDQDTDDLLEFFAPDATVEEKVDLVIHQLKMQTLSQLWHQRLGHVNPETVSQMHKHVDGIPKLSRPTLLDTCPICIAAKMQKSPASSDNSRVATTCFQGISLDFGFIVSKSKNSDRYVDNLGLNGETCYILIIDHFSGMLFGQAFQTKAPPIPWLNQWLARYTPDIPNKTARFDQGGELGRCKAVLDLFRNFGYSIELTGADASHQNGCVERYHKTIGNMMRTLLNGAELSRKFWPYAFQHSLFLLNRIIHDGKDDSPLTICTKKKISLQQLRTFGCRVFVRTPGDRPSKLDSNNRIGIFLGYTNTMKNILWYDNKSNTVKMASHVRFDEGMSDTENPPPNIQILRRTQDGLITTTDDCPIDDPVDIDIDISPFRELITTPVAVTCQHPTFGFELGECHLRRRVFISNLITNTSASKVRNFRRKYIGAYIVQVGHIAVYDLKDATAAFASLRDDASITKFDIIIAPDKYVPPKDRQEHMHLDIGQIRSITALRELPASTADITPDIPTDISDFSHSPFPSDDDIRFTLHSLLTMGDPTTVPLSAEEAASKGKFTRAKLKRLATWKLWLDAETKQLDAMLEQGMFGDPCDPPIGALILWAHWNYYMKADGTRQARNCCDGSMRAAPQLRTQAYTFSSCVEQPCARCFYAICAALGYIILCTDVKNAYANADAPSVPTYIHVDEAYAEWYFNKFGKRIPRGKVLPVLHALQGHPESGRLWETFINRILLKHFGLRNTTHERNLYTGTFNDKPILIMRQVDDIAVASPCTETARAFIAALGQHVQLKGNDILSTFNGVQVEQSSDYIRLHCTRYIERLVTAHGWDTTVDDATTPYHNNSHPREPISTALFQQIDKEMGPLESSPEGKALARTRGFKYCQLLGELMYAYIICRLDIGYILIKLAQFSTNPAPIHYTCLKRITIYLRSTKHWGITYWRPCRLPTLPAPQFPAEPTDTNMTNIPTFPHTSEPLQLVGYVDASYATDVRTRRLVTGFVITLCGAAICYRSKLQPTVSTSSTEAEFIAAVTAAKAVKYLRSVLADLGDIFKPTVPTTIYEDNTAAIEMVNAGKPTNRTRHVDVQLFAIQEWKDRGDIILSHIPGTINIADALTKALGWILHNRHVRRAMGHFYPPWKTFVSWISTKISPSP